LLGASTTCCISRAFTATTTSGDAALRKRFPSKLTGEGAVGKAILSRKPAWVVDFQTAPGYSAKFRQEVRERGYRSLLAVPMIRDGEAIGALTVSRKEPGSFDRHQIDLLKIFADQAVIAIENVRLFNETKEALERQTATAEVLQVLSGSPSSLQPVFEAILGNAARLCSSHLALLNLYQDGKFRTAAQFGGNPKFVKWVFERGAFDPSGSVTLVRMIETRRPVQAEDLKQSEAYRAGKGQTVNMVNVGGAQTFLAVPLLKDGELVGNIGIYRPEVRPFTDKQIDLVRSFADQAVIAIENVRLFNETKEALERQTATAEILKVIAGSPTDVQPVFDAIAASVLRLFGAHASSVTRLVGDMLHLAAFTATSEAGNEALRRSFPRPLSSPGTHTTAALSRKPAYIVDFENDANVSPELKAVVRARGIRSQLSVPMLREGVTIGTIAVTRTEPGPFSDHQISLMETFADQAVIAIENVRLFNETKEALERQTATAEILRVIASSPTDVQPVFDVIVERAVKLCGARFGRVYRYDGSMIQMVAGHGLSTGGLQKVQSVFPRPAADDTIAGRVILERQPFFLRDIERDNTVPALSRQMIKALNTRSQVTVPMLRAGEPIGAITLGWDQPDGFDDRQVALLQTFADQAVIAIENVRLFNETKEALERQTATAEILDVIAKSPADVQPVLDAVCESAARLCGASDALIMTAEAGVLTRRAHVGPITSVSAARPLTSGTSTGRAVLERRTIHVDDILAEIERGDYLESLELQRRSGMRTILSVPLMREDWVIGVLTIRRLEVRPFTEKQIKLVKTFADQAVIAIEKRAPLQRDERGARPADGDRRDPASHERLSDRYAAGVRRDREQRRPPVRSQGYAAAARGRRSSSQGTKRIDHRGLFGSVADRPRQPGRASRPRCEAHAGD
jgi:GAF domain-containing protein